MADGLEEFILQCAVDEKVASALRLESETVQAAVMRTDMQGARNASALIASRIKQEKKKETMQDWAGADPEEVESFLSKWEIDEKASNALRGLPPPMQKSVMSKPMDQCTNKSSALMSRIGKACSGDRMYGGGLVGGMDAEEVESFLSQWEIDEKASNALRELPPPIQKSVMSQPMDQCTNKSSALMSRIGKACSGDRMYGVGLPGGMGGKGGMKGKGGKGGKGGMKGMGGTDSMGGMEGTGGMMQLMMGNMMQMQQMMQMMVEMKTGGKGGGKFNPY